MKTPSIFTIPSLTCLPYQLWLGLQPDHHQLLLQELSTFCPFEVSEPSLWYNFRQLDFQLLSQGNVTRLTTDDQLLRKLWEPSLNLFIESKWKYCDRPKIENRNGASETTFLDDHNTSIYSVNMEHVRFLSTTDGSTWLLCRSHSHKNEPI
ncbi:unnamed protein product [Nesidiocoris tenuis]|uniref:Uncharacterized protein n=1 Tax=Nesidiocoris tenuis TaxID=355587 RepID=A0A6H5HRW2_9HEMI|nr:unnamed protein product [Nesidiocoris tenuis]